MQPKSPLLAEPCSSFVSAGAEISEIDGGVTLIELTDNTDLGEYTNSPVAVIIYQKQYDHVYTYHADAQGNIVAISAEDGTILEKYAYDVYGRLTYAGIWDSGTQQYDAVTTSGGFVDMGAYYAASSIGNEIFFQGRRWDNESGLYYFRNRYYDPETGRFLSRDPAGPVDGPNLYAFVNNNPMNYVDPMGLRTLKEINKDLEDAREKERGVANLYDEKIARAKETREELANNLGTARGARNAVAIMDATSIILLGLLEKMLKIPVSKALAASGLLCAVGKYPFANTIEANKSVDACKKALESVDASIEDLKRTKRQKCRDCNVDYYLSEILERHAMIRKARYDLPYLKIHVATARERLRIAERAHRANVQRIMTISDQQLWFSALQELDSMGYFELLDRIRTKTILGRWISNAGIDYQPFAVKHLHKAIAKFDFKVTDTVWFEKQLDIPYYSGSKIVFQEDIDDYRDILIRRSEKHYELAERKKYLHKMLDKLKYAEELLANP